MIPHVNLTVPKPYRNTMRRFCLKWTCNNLRPSFKEDCLTHKEMLTFFINRYRKGNYLSSCTLDGAIDWYLTPLEHFEVYFSFLPNNKEVLALDMGCGAASVGYWLRKNGYKWSYLGVDNAETAEHFFENLEDADFFAKNVLDVEAKDLPKKPDIIFVVNLLCFIPETEFFLKKLRELGHEKTQLVLIEGHPAKFWTKKMPSNLYKTQDLVEILSRNGWQTKKTVKLGLYNFFNKSLFTISHGFLCSRK